MRAKRSTTCTTARTRSRRCWSSPTALPPTTSRAQRASDDTQADRRRANAPPTGCATAKAGSGTATRPRRSRPRPIPAAPQPPARAGRVRGDAEAPGRPEARRRHESDRRQPARLHALPAHGDEQVRALRRALAAPGVDRARARLRPDRTAHQRDGDQRLRRTAARPAGADRREPGRHPRAPLHLPQRLPVLPPLRADPEALRAGVRHDRASPSASTAAACPSTRTPGPTTASPRA